MTSENTHDLLADIVSRIRCKPGWRFALREYEGALRLVITVVGQDSYNPSCPLTVAHLHPVPIATYNERTWLRWIFEQCRRVENHELGEWFRVANGPGEDTVELRRPFAPLHGPGEDPYTVHEYREEKDAQTVQNGSISEGIRV